jgi:hypothetical protein
MDLSLSTFRYFYELLLCYYGQYCLLCYYVQYCLLCYLFNIVCCVIILKNDTNRQGDVISSGSNLAEIVGNRTGTIVYSCGGSRGLSP